MLEIIVHGVPAPQGSKTRTRFGVREDNPNTMPWRAAVAAEASRVMNGDELLDGPLWLEALFVFPRPKSHFGSGGRANVLKESAPSYHATQPDYDKLARAIGDALTGIVIRDDARIADAHIRKVYGHPARAEIRIRPA